MAGKKNKPKIIDLFAGVGGISSGFKKAGFEVVAANEYKSEIANTYIRNHPKTKMIIDDITRVKSKDLLNGEGEIDVIVGGPPCQGFSMAGRRIRNGGTFLNDPRNELFKEFIRVVKDIKPKVFVMENVAAMLNIHGGAVRDEIIKRFEEIGYKTKIALISFASTVNCLLSNHLFFLFAVVDLIRPQNLKSHCSSFCNQALQHNLLRHLTLHRYDR
jgi:DNA (cytosine-5)-methyltransferase 1